MKTTLGLYVRFGLVFLLLVFGKLINNTYGQYLADNDRSYGFSDALPTGSCSGACSATDCSVFGAGNPAYSISEYYRSGSPAVANSNTWIGTKTIDQRKRDAVYGGHPNPEITSCQFLYYLNDQLVISNWKSVQFVDFETTNGTPSFCEGGSIDLSATLTYTNGVTWSGAGVNSAGLFTGNTAAVYNVMATREFDNGTSTIDFTITVHAKPSLTFNDIPNQCSDSPDVDLYEYTSVDEGTFTVSSNGAIVGGHFLDISNSQSGVGITISQSYTNSNGCTKSINTIAQIEQDLVVDAGANQSGCNNSGETTLNATTSGVSWTCVGCGYVQNGKFNTDAAPAGTYTVRATKTVGACTDTDDKTFTVKALPVVNAGVDLEYCISVGTITLNGASPLNGTYTGTGVNGDNMNLAMAGVGSHTITYIFTDAQGCTNSDTRIVKINGLPSSNGIVTNTPERCGSGQVTYSGSLAGNTIRWYNAASGGSLQHTGDDFPKSIGVGTTTYYASATINGTGCVSATRKAVAGVAHPVPSQPSADHEDRCGAGSVTLDASGGISGATYRWYENSTGGSPVHTGASFPTPSLSTSRSYYVDAISPLSCLNTGGRRQVDVTINSIPGEPTTFPDSNCGPGVVSLLVGGTPAGGEYRWYTQASSGSSFNNTNSISPNLSATTDYWVSIVTAKGCEGSRKKITGTIFDTPSAPSGSGGSRCGAGSVSLSVTGANADFFNWYDTDASAVSLHTGTTFSPSVTSSRSYWVEMTDNNGCISPRDEVGVTIHPIPVNPTADDNGRCGPGVVTLSASGSGAGANYSWYENPTGGLSLHTGDNFSTTSLTTSKTYYVAATSSNGCISAGRTEVVAEIQGIPSVPIVFDNFNCGSGIVTLTVAGTPSGGDYRWYPSESGGSSFNNASTFDANIAVTESYWVSAVSSAGCEGLRAEIVASIHDIPSPPVGNDNERCGPGTVDLSASSAVIGTFDWYETQASQVSLFSGPSYTTTSLTETTSYWVELTDDNTCISERTEVVATVHPIPPDPTAASVGNCGPGKVTSSASGGGSEAVYEWFNNPTGGSPLFIGSTFEPIVSTTRNYYVDVTTPEGCTSINRTEVTVTINVIPSEPIVFDGENCGPGTVSLSAGGTPVGGEYRWYTSPIGGTSFNTTNMFDADNTATTSYWISAVSAEGCEGARAEIVATINSILSAPNGMDGDRCGPGVVNLSASSGISGTFNWYDTEVSQVSLSVGDSYQTPGLTVSGSYWVDITDANGCVSPRIEVIATVYNIPDEPTVPDVERCGPGNVTIVASGSVAGAIFDWYDNDVGGNAIFTGASFGATLSLSRSYYVSATSPEGCVSDSRTEVVVTINPLPTEPLVFDNDNCGVGTVNLTVAGASAGGEYRWYPSENGGSSFNSNSTYDADISGTTSYWVSIVTPETCEGPRKEIVATINSIPDAPVGVNGELCGTGTVNLSASNSVGGTFNWYETQASQVSLFTGVNFVTPSIINTRSYWVDITDSNGCVSLRSEVTATINDIPVEPTAPGVERCGDGEVTISASGSVSGAIYIWYSNSTGGVSLFTGTDYTVNVTSSRSYYVSTTSSEGCVSGGRTEVVVTINPFPSAPIAIDGENCGSGQVTVSTVGAPAEGEYRWYQSSSGGVSFNNQSSFNANISSTTSYWVSIITSDGCEGPRAEVVATINDIPTTPSGIDGQGCGTGSVSLSANSAVSGSYNWYQTEVSQVSLFTGVNFVTPNISITTSYWVDITDVNGCVSPRTEVVATVNSVPTEPNVPDVERCGSGDVTMNASGGTAGTVYDWYTSSSGGSPVFTGDQYTATVTSTRSFYVSGSSPDGCLSNDRTEVVVTINPFPSVPIVIDGENCGPGDVSVSVAGAPAGGSYRWYQNESGGTSFNSSSSFDANVTGTISYWISIVTPQTCEGPREEVVATVNVIPDAPFGIGGERCGTGTVGISANSGIAGSLNWYETQASQVSLFSGVNFVTANINSTTSYWVDITDLKGCVSARTEVVATVNAVPNEPIVSDVERCGAGDVTMTASGGITGAIYDWYTSASGGSSLFTGDEYTATVSSTRSFYVSATSADNCISENRTVVVITINPIPSAPITFDAANCGPGDVIISVAGTPSGGDYRWYQNENGGTSFNNTNSFEATVTENTSYWVSIVTANGCEGPREEVIAVINDIPVAPSGIDGQRCGTGSVDISANSGIAGSFNWFDNQVSAVGLFTGVNFATPSISITRSYWVDLTDGNGCVGTRTEVVATINDIPFEPNAPNVNRCGPGDVTMLASGGISGTIYNWYTSASGGSPIFTGDEFINNVSSSRSFYVSASSPEGCTSNSRSEVMVAINPFPSAPLATDGENCGPGDVTVSVGGAPADGQYRWYLVENGGTSFNNTNSYEASITNTTSYWVSIVTPEGCEGPRVEVEATVNDIPVAPSAINGQRCGTGSIDLSANSSVAGSFNWYDTQVSAVSLFTGVNFATPSLSSSRSYWVDLTDLNGCVSPRKEVIATVNIIPFEPSSTDVERCGSGEVTMSASGGITGAIYDWFTSASGGSPVFTGIEYTTNVASSRSFYVSARSTFGCTSDNRTEVVVTINPIPSEPITLGGNNCGPEEITISVAGAPSGGSYRWYQSENGGTSFNSSSSFDANITETSSYWVSIITSKGCEGPRVEVIGTINDIPVAPSGIAGERCGIGSVNLSANSGVSGSLNWYDTQVSAVSLFTGVNFATPAISFTRSYWVDLTDANGCISERTVVIATVNNVPFEPNAPAVQRCGPGDVTMTASGIADGTYRWYSSASGGAPLFIGESYTTTVTTSQNFFADVTTVDGCTSENRTQVTATVNVIPSQPLVFSGENCGQGAVSLSVAGTPVGGQYRWYDAPTGGTSFNSSSVYGANISETTSYWVSIVTVEGCEGPRKELIATINEIPAAPFGIDGQRCGTGSVSLTANSGIAGGLNWYASSVSNVSLFTGTNFLTPVIPATTSYWVDLTDANGCVSTRTEVIATVNQLPFEPISDNIERCGAGEVTLNASSNVPTEIFRWYLSSSGGSQQFEGDTYIVNVSSSRSFYVSAVSGVGCESASRTEVAVTINTVPSGPVVFDGANCGVGDVLLGVGGAPAGGEYRWYLSAIDPVSFNSTTSFTANITETTSYFVSTVSAQGCEGPRSEIVATIYDALAAPNGIAWQRCGIGQVSLSADSGLSGTFNWYDSDVSQASLFGGANFLTPTINTTRSYWVDITDADGCVSARTQVTATVHPLPKAPDAQNVEICGAGEVTMNASGSVDGAYKWYLSSSGGSSLFEGDIYITNVSSSRSFYVSAISPESCESDVRTEVIVSINPIPSEPLAFDNENCGVGVVTLSVAGAPSGGEYRWYQTASGGTSFNVTSTFDAVISTTTSYWVSIITPEGCEGARAEIIGTINDIPVPPTAVDGVRCGPGSVPLSVNSGISGSFNWYETQASQVSQFTGVNFNTPGINETTSFWVDITDVNGCLSPRIEVVATVNNLPEQPLADDVDRCGAGQVILTATGSVESAAYNWYSSSSGGSVLFTGPEFTTDVSLSRSFYVSTMSPESCESSIRTQVVVTINEIPSAPLTFDGESCGEGEVGLSVAGASAGGEYRWYQNQVGGTSFNSEDSFVAFHDVTTTYWVSIISAEGCEGPRSEVVATVNEIPIAPNGNAGENCGPGSVSLSATSAVSGTFSWYETQASQISLFAGVNFQTPNLSTTTSYWVDITNSNGCTSPRTMITATIHNIPVDPVADDVDRCGAGDVELTASGSVSGAIYNWYNNSAGGSPIHVGETFSTFVGLTRNFYVEALSPEGCESNNRTQVRVNINAFPGEAIVFDGENCGPGEITLNVAGASAGGDYRWYLSEKASSSFNSSNSWDADVDENTTYFVAIVTPQGCEGPREPIIAVVNDIPEAPIGFGGERCGTGSVGLSTSSIESGTFNWYATQASSVSLFTGVNYNTPYISSTTSYWVDFKDLNDCVSTRTEVMAIILDVIPDPVVENVERCGAGEVSITAIVNSQGETFEWYENQFGGTLIFVGDTYQTTLSLSDNYFVSSISDAGCVSVNRTPVTVTINPKPTTPLVTDGNTCGPGLVTLRATGAPVGGDYHWYEGEISDVIIATGTEYTTAELNTTSSYFVTIVNEFDCEGSRASVDAIVNGFPDVPSVQDELRCGVGDIDLRATTNDGTVNWYFNNSGGDAFATGNKITIDNLDETTVYYAASVSAQGCESNRTAVTATIEPILGADIGDNTQICLNAGVYDLSADLEDVNSTDGIFAGAGVIGTNFHADIAGIGNHEITFILTTEKGCLDNGSRFITVIDIKKNGEELILSGTEITKCINDGSIDLNALPNVAGGDWIINAIEGSINVGIVDPVVTGVGEFIATYSVEINGCTVTTEIPVNVTDSPQAPTVTASTLICSGQSAELQALGGQAGTLYHWYSNDDTESFASGSEIQVQPQVATTYKVEAENAFGCISPLTEHTIEVVNVELDFSATPQAIFVGERVELSTQVEAASYLWDFGDNLTSIEQNPSHIFFEEGNFNVSLSVVTNDGCNLSIEKQDLILVEVDPQNTVTGIDDELTIKTPTVYPQPFKHSFTLKMESKSYQKASLYIFSLSGNLVIEKQLQLISGENEVVLEGLENKLTDGMYLLKIVDASNKSYDHRIIKKQ